MIRHLADCLEFRTERVSVGRHSAEYVNAGPDILNTRPSRVKDPIPTLTYPAKMTICLKIIITWKRDK